MTLSSLLILLLVTGWVVPAIMVALAYVVWTPSSDEAEPREMSTVLKGLRAEAGQPDLDARTQAWRRAGWGGPARYVQARITESSHEVMVLTRYAEASVSVAGKDGCEHRRASLCLN